MAQQKRRSPGRPKKVQAEEMQVTVAEAPKPKKKSVIKRKDNLSTVVEYEIQRGGGVAYMLPQKGVTVFDKENNTVHNLEWSTPSENSLHSVHVLGNRPAKGCDNKLARLTEQQASYVKLKYIPRHRLFGARALGRELGVHHSTILKYLKEDA